MFNKASTRRPMRLIVCTRRYLLFYCPPNAAASLAESINTSRNKSHDNAFHFLCPAVTGPATKQQFSTTTPLKASRPLSVQPLCVLYTCNHVGPTAAQPPHAKSTTQLSRRPPEPPATSFRARHPGPWHRTIPQRTTRVLGPA